MGTSSSIALENEIITWQQAHAALSRLARERAAADAKEGRWLLAAERAAVHEHLGYGGFSEYIERLFGYKPRWTREKLRVAAALEGLPALASALVRGELSWSAVRELTRVAVGETEHEWLEYSRGKTLRQLEQVLAGRRPGDVPGSLPDSSERRRVLRFDVAAETFALLSDALRELRRRAGGALDDDSALLEMARCILGSPVNDEGRANYQVVLSVCPECNTARQHSAAGLVPVGSELIRRARCDAQHVPTPLARSPLPANDLSPHETAARRETDDSHDSAVSAGADTHDGAVSHHGAVADATESATTHVGPSSRAPRVVRRAAQTIPPALRRAVLLRDQRRCQVPGCQNTSWLDVHHLELRSEGGPHSLENLVCICGAHHRAAHRGHLLLDRAPDGALRVRHADGGAYGGAVRSQELEVRSKVFSALRQLGFREAQVRAALEQLLREPALGPLEPPSFDGLLRAALSRLCPSAGGAERRAGRR